MTFCCLPSKNCFHCRQRRIKCDRAIPACSQCKRAGKECVGYRDEGSLLFRDENARTIRRAVAAKKRSWSKNQKIVQGGDHPPLEVAVRSVNIIGGSLSSMFIDIEDQGLYFFFHHFSSVPWANGRIMQEEKRAHMFETLDIDPSFRNAVASVGLAAMSNVRQDSALLTLARQRYGMAIRAVRDVVQNPSHGNLGNLLKMIVMVAIFEFVDAKPEALHAWTVHVSGAAALLRRFPFPQVLLYNTQAELWFYFGVIIKYFQVGGAFPTELEIWPIQRKNLAPGDTWPAFSLIDILIRFIRVCAAIPNRSEAEVEDILREALASETELQDWADGLPARWSFVAKENIRQPRTFYGKYHVYQDAWAPRVLSHYRLGRLLANEVILAYIGKLEESMPKWTKRRSLSLTMVNQMATEICIGAASQALSTDCGAGVPGSLPCPLLKGTFMLIYPLTAAARATGVSDDLRDWVIQTLRTIGQTTGIRQAVEAIPQLQRAGANRKAILGWM